MFVLKRPITPPQIPLVLTVATFYTCDHEIYNIKEILRILNVPSHTHTHLPSTIPTTTPGGSRIMETLKPIQKIRDMRRG